MPNSGFEGLGQVVNLKFRFYALLMHALSSFDFHVYNLVFIQ